MTKCAWCDKETEKVFPVISLGTKMQICESCKNTRDKNICRNCGTPLGMEETNGLCLTCYSEEVAEKVRLDEERIAGTSPELLECYSSGIEFTEEDYEQWVTFGQGNFSKEYMKRCRQNWLRTRLVEQGGWSAKLVENNLDAIEGLMEKHISKVLSRRCILIYSDPKVNKKRIHNIIDFAGNIYLIEKK